MEIGILRVARADPVESRLAKKLPVFIFGLQHEGLRLSIASQRGSPQTAFAARLLAGRGLRRLYITNNRKKVIEE